MIMVFREVGTTSEDYPKSAALLSFEPKKLAFYNEEVYECIIDRLQEKK